MRIWLGTFFFYAFCFLCFGAPENFIESFNDTLTDKWQSKNIPSLQAGGLEAEEKSGKILEFSRSRQNIFTKNASVKPDKDGYITVQWDFRALWKSGHMNMYFVFGRQKNTENVNLWFYANGPKLSIFNRGKEKNKLLTLSCSYVYRVVDVLNLKQKKHTLIIAAKTAYGWRTIFTKPNLSFNMPAEVKDESKLLNYISISSGRVSKTDVFSFQLDDLSIRSGRHFKKFPEAKKVSYKYPPQREVWLEGENCKQHNWVEGPSWHCWAYGWCGVHGGLLDLASWRLPNDGAYVAKFPFDLKEEGKYTIYYLGRSTYFSSPINWSIDLGPSHRYPPLGKRHNYKELAYTQYIKYSVMELGTADLKAGGHVLNISISEPFDNDGKYYCQQIDAILISKAGYPIAQPAPKISEENRRRHTSQNLYSTEDISETKTPSEKKGVPVAIWGEDIFKDSSGGKDVRRKSNKISSLTLPSLKIDRTNCSIAEVLTSIKGKIICKSQKTVPLLSVRFLSGKRSEFIKGLQWKKSGRSVLCCGTGDGFMAKLTFRYDIDNADVSISVEITNTSNEPIDSVRWSLLNGIGLDSKWKNARWIVGANRYKGAKIKNIKCLISPSFKFDWVTIYDDDSLFYCFFKDKKLLDTRVIFQGRNENKGGVLWFEKYPRINPGRKWESPSLVIGAGDNGDWHMAAKRFKQWWESWARNAYIPKWFKSIGGMARAISIFGSPKMNDLSVNEIVKINQKRQEKITQSTGIEAFHGSGWLPRRSEGWFPLNYQLIPKDLRKMRSVFQKLIFKNPASIFSIYTNPLMFSRVTPEFEVYGRGLAVRGKDNLVYMTEHTARHHPMALPYPGVQWAKMFVNSLESVVVLTDVSSLYLDQIGAVPAHLDYSNTTGHHDYGQWVAGSVEFCKYVVEKLREKKSFLAVGIEHPNPAMQQYATYGLLVYGDRPSEILRYIFPKQIHFVGSYNPASTKALEKYAKEAFLTGLPIFYGGVKKGNTIPDIYKKIVLFKKKFDPELYTGIYQDNLGLQIDGNVEMKAFISKSGKVMLPYVRNQKGGNEKVVVNLNTLLKNKEKRVKKACFVSIDKSEAFLPLKINYIDKNSISFAVPEDIAGIIWLD